MSTTNIRNFNPIYVYALFDKDTQAYVGYEDGVVEADCAATVLFNNRQEAVELQRDIKAGIYISGKELKEHAFEIHKFQLIQELGSRR